MPFYTRLVELYLKKLAIGARVELLKLCSYEYRQRNTYIFKESDPSNEKAYVVLRGQVRLLEGKAKPDKDKYKEVQFSKRVVQIIQVIRQRLFPVLRFAQCSRFNKMAYEVEEFPVNESTQKTGKLADAPGTFKRGQVFGLEAIGRKGKKAFRQLSAYTETDVDLLVITRKDLMHVLNVYEEEKVARFDYLYRLFPEISAITSQVFLESVLYSLSQAFYSRDEFVTRQGSPGNKLFFILEGEVEVRKRVEPQFDVKSRSFVSPNHRPVDVAICHLVKNQFFGEEVLLDKAKGLHEYSVKVYSEKLKVLEGKLGQIYQNFLPTMVEKLKNHAVSIEKARRVFFQSQFNAKLALEPLARETQFKELQGAKNHLRPTISLCKKPLGTRSTQHLRIKFLQDSLEKINNDSLSTLNKHKAAELYSFSRIHILPTPQASTFGEIRPIPLSNREEAGKPIFLSLSEQIKMQADFSTRVSQKSKNLALDPIWKLSESEEKILAYRKDLFHKHTRSLSTLQQSGRSVVSVGHWYSHIKGSAFTQRKENPESKRNSSKVSFATDRSKLHEGEPRPKAFLPYSRKSTKTSVRASDIFVTKKESNFD